MSCGSEKDPCRGTCPTILGVVEESNGSSTDGYLIEFGRSWVLWLYKIIVEGQGCKSRRISEEESNRLNAVLRVHHV